MVGLFISLGLDISKTDAKKKIKQAVVIGLLAFGISFLDPQTDSGKVRI